MIDDLLLICLFIVNLPIHCKFAHIQLRSKLLAPLGKINISLHISQNILNKTTECKYDIHRGMIYSWKSYFVKFTKVCIFFLLKNQNLPWTKMLAPLGTTHANC